MANSRVLIVAAEASSGLYAQRLLEEWNHRNIQVDAFGVGTESMENMGFRRLGCSEDMAVVGIKEVLKHYSEIKSVFNSILEECKKNPPKFALLLDYPDFNLRLAEKLHSLGIKVIYYISPQLWAWRKGRIHKIKKFIDKVLVLFPFEKEFYDKHEVNSAFVGHPLLDEVSKSDLSEAKRIEQRQRIGLESTDLLIGLMPGSRRSEIEHHLLDQIKTAELVHEKNPSVQFALFIAPSLKTSEIKSLLPMINFPLKLVQDEPLKMVNMADFILTASGTATLVVGLLKKPMLVMYKMNPLTAWLVKRVVTGVDHFAMVNLILESNVVPELFQEEANPKAMSEILNNWISDNNQPSEITKKLGELSPKLGDCGATKRVADELMEFI